MCDACVLVCVVYVCLLYICVLVYMYVCACVSMCVHACLQQRLTLSSSAPKLCVPPFIEAVCAPIQHTVADFACVTLCAHVPVCACASVCVCAYRYVFRLNQQPVGWGNTVFDIATHVTTVD